MGFHDPNDKKKPQGILQSGDAHDSSNANITSSINNRNFAPQFLCQPEMRRVSTGYRGEIQHSTNADSVINQGVLQNPDIGGTGSINHFQIVDGYFSLPKNIDKRPQTLGIEGNKKPSWQRPRTKFSTKQIASKPGSSPAHGSGSSTFLANDDAALHRLSESSLSFSQTEQTDKQHHSLENSGGSLAFVGQTSSRNSQMYLPQNFQGNQRAGEQIRSSRNIGGSMFPEFLYASNPMDNRGLVGHYHLAQITPEQKLPFHGNILTNNNHLGGSGTQAFEGSPFSLSAQPVGQQSSSGQVTPLPLIGNSSSPQEMGISNIQPVIRNQFPTRLGVSQAGQEQLLRAMCGTQQTGQGIPTAIIPQASNIHGKPSLGRRARESSPKIYMGRNPPQTPRPSSPALLPQDYSQPLIPSGHQCMLCKRDVWFTPDGPVSQPSPRPPVAVLPCKHVFHDECLQKITPEDQATNPPCIPCATGEE